MRCARVVTVVLLCCQWLGCGQQERHEVESARSVDLESIDPSGQKVRFWYQHTRQREDELLRMIAEYNQANPHGIEVTGEYAGNYGNIYNKMLVALQGGVPPSLVVAYQNQALAYYEADGVVDLNPYIASKKWGLTAAEREDLVEAFMEQDRIDGVQIGFPPNRSLETLYYNSDWLAELGFAGPPQTWDAFAEMCRKAVEQPFSRAADKKNCLGFYIQADASRLASMVFSRGSDLINAEKTAYTIDTPAMHASLNLISELVADGAVRLLGEDYGDQTAFFVGEVLFVLRSTSGLPNFRQGIEEAGSEFEWSVTTLPHGDGPPVVNIYGASVSICRTTPAEQLATWLFLRWFTQPEQQASWVRASNYFPARKSAAAGLGDYFSANEKYGKAYELIEHGRSEPGMAGYQQVRRLIADAIVEVVDGGDVASILERLERRANDTLNEY